MKIKCEIWIVDNQALWARFNCILLWVYLACQGGRYKTWVMFLFYGQKMN